MTRFAAIDFETADHCPDSACALGIVLAERGRIIDRVHRLIRPPRREFIFTYIHGIAWRHVRDQPTFAELWPDLSKVLKNAEFLAAHNAPFDTGVLRACCGAAGVASPRKRFVCTVRLARQVWNIYPTTLPDVCGKLGIPLKHHDAASDAEACANIVLAAQRIGASI
ncbi:MAG: 3'-5' exonuclease [Pseudomonadota bacterium]